MAKPQLDPFSSSSSSSSSSSCKTTTKIYKINNINMKKSKRKENDNMGNIIINFSESEIDAAEQLIQLSGDSDDIETNSTIISDGDTTMHHHHHDLIIAITSSSSNSNNHDDDNVTPCGTGPVKRKNKRFKPLSEIYSLTKPLIVSAVNIHYRC